MQRCEWPAAQKPILENLKAIWDKLAALEPLSLDSLNTDESLVISIDMNNGFAKAGELYSERVEKLVEPASAFIDRCIERCLKIIAFSDRHGESSPEVRVYPPHCMEETVECELVDELSRIKPFMVFKNSTNAFFAGGEEFAGPRFKNYIVTGCLTDLCIYQFAVTLRAYLNEHNIPDAQVIVPLSLTDTYDAPWHQAGLFNLVFADSMLQNGIRVVSEIV